jgi:hypothetical protein
MKHWILFLFSFSLISLQGQETDVDAVEIPEVRDSLGQILNPRYREDQFYLGVNFNLLLNFPEGVTQNGLSYGLQGGFIRDFPLNEDCTFALGIGIGYGFNSYYSNLRALENGVDLEYVVLTDADSYRRNKLETHVIEVPLEFRWRNSTRETFKFWRIYGGAKFGYIVGSRSKYVTNEFVDSFNNPDTENFTYGLTLNVGYNTFNLHLYYGLNTLFEDGVNGPDGQQLEMSVLRLGLIFYIL